MTATMLPDGMEAYFWARVEKNGPIPVFRPELGNCWIWQGEIAKGYGQICRMRSGRRTRLSAHRFSFLLSGGVISADKVLDHLCRVRACVNPQHLEAVSQRENVLRGLKGRLVVACPRGHSYTPQNTYWAHGRRVCRACRLERLKSTHTAEYWREWRRKRSERRRQVAV